jgi:class III poly(R)-hydroxyalkanoic acid synthase PhaE subunit
MTAPSDWNNQTQQWFDLWQSVQQQMWNIWGGMAQTAASSTAALPVIRLNGTFADAWQEMLREGIQATTRLADPTAQDVAQKMFTNQLGIVRLLNLTTRIWQNFLPAIAEGKDWETLLKEQMALIHSEFRQIASDGLHLSGNYTQLWQTFLQESIALSQPWTKAVEKSGQYFGKAAVGDRAALMEIAHLYWDAFQDTFGNWLQMPGLGYTREFDTKLRQTFTAWVDLQQATLEYNLTLADIWLDAIEELMRGLGKLAQTGESPESLRDFINRWSAIADEVFKGAFRSEEYVNVQSKLINTLMSYRQQQRQITELYLQMVDIPARTEVDEAHRRIHLLQKEVKTLHRELTALKAQLAAGTTARKSLKARKSHS